MQQPLATDTQPCGQADHTGHCYTATATVLMVSRSRDVDVIIMLRLLLLVTLATLTSCTVDDYENPASESG